MTQLHDWQVASAQALAAAVSTYGVAADGSDTGTGKTYKVCAVAREHGWSLRVVCPKSLVPEWERVAALFNVPCVAINYERVRTGKTPFGKWQVKGKVFEWAPAPNARIVFDEAHRLGGLDTQLSRLLIAAKRQQLPMVLLSATMIANPLKGYALGYALDLHRLVNFWPWARANGVVDGFYGPEWAPHKLKPTPRTCEEVMQSIRLAMGARFTRIRKSEVPGFPDNQIIPTFVATDELPEIESYFGVEARRLVELEKVPGLIEKANELRDEGFAVAIFVNFLGTVDALVEAFPHAAVVRGGQTPLQRREALNSFQQNQTDIIVLTNGAGGTGVSLHDLNGKPRASLICPSHDVIEFQQSLGRIHRAGSLSPAVNYIVFASGVPVERRIRARLEAKLNNLSALNDADLNDNNQYAHGPAITTDADSSGSAQTTGGDAENAVSVHADDDHRDSSPGRLDLGGRVDGAVRGSDRLGSPDGGRTRADAHSGAVAVPPLMEGPLMPPRKIIADAIDVVATPVAAQQLSTPVPVDATATGNHVVRKHARCSPSKLKNLEICPSYEGDETNPPHPVTLRGTAMHEALETGDDSKLLTELDNEELRLVTMCRDFQAAEAVPGETVILEPHLKTHDADVQGFADRLVLEPVRPDGTRRARIRDYKMGWNPVDLPDVNPQAVAYTVATFLEYRDVTEINFAFLIPRLDMVLEHTFTRADLPALQLRLSTIADRVRKFAGKEHNLVESNCLYCGAKADCPAVLAKMLPIRNGVVEADRLPVPASLDITKITDPQQIAYGLNLANMAEDWAQKFKAFALSTRLELGQEIPGYDLIERRAKREITNTVAAYNVAKEFGVTETEYIAAAKVSITSLETSVKEHAPHGAKEEYAASFSDRLADEGAMSRGASFHVLQRSRKKKAAALPAA